MRILITGDAGFIGKALCAELETRGHEPLSFDVARSALQDVATEAVSYGFDNEDRLGRKIELVVHLAAEVGKLNCENNPQKALQTNVVGTLNVAKACAARGVPLIYCSTSEVYGDHGDAWVDEDGLVDEVYFQERGGLSAKTSGMYALTKRWGEEICKTYAPEGLKIVRPTMPYGPGVPPGPGRRALDNLVWQALTGQPMIVHRGAARSWCWIDDLARGFADVIEKGEPGIYNVGRDDDEVSMYDLAMKIKEHPMLRYAKPQNIIYEVDPPARQTAVKRISCAKLRALGWGPQTSLDEGLPQMISWVKQWMAAHEGELVP